MYTCKCHTTYFIVKTKICQGDNTFVHLDKQLKKGWEGGLDCQSLKKILISVCVCAVGMGGGGAQLLSFIFKSLFMNFHYISSIFP